MKLDITCLCPTYCARPASLVANSIACFEAQTYPASHQRRLIVLDDTGHFEAAHGACWDLFSHDDRHDTLPEKYN